MPPERPRVSVSDGWVTLEGTVQREFQRQLIEKAVREVAGVRGITNALVVAFDSHSG
jgi:osmotically-inducible protein OsmY